MALFSERHGYTKPSDIIIRERLTPEIENAILNYFESLKDNHFNTYHKLGKQAWIAHLNQRANLYGRSGTTPIDYLSSQDIQWYQKLDYIEFILSHLKELEAKPDRDLLPTWTICLSDKVINTLNTEFERLHFGYRIVDMKIAEISSEQEINAIETTLRESPSNVQMHLSKAFELYAKRPEADYSNSIKESISAVEAYCREQTETKTLGEALKALSSKGINIPPMLKTSFEKLYAYTNDSKTGIRHALISDEENAFIPEAEEALFMLVSCSSFLSYLYKKSTKASIESNKDK